MVKNLWFLKRRESSVEQLKQEVFKQTYKKKLKI